MKGYPLGYAARTVETVEEFLRTQPGHGAVLRTPDDGEQTAFLCEVAAGEQHFFLRICVEEELGFLRCDLYPETGGRDWPRENLAGWCAEKNKQWKIGTLQADVQRGIVFAHTETSFRDGAVSRDTLACLEQIMLTMLLEGLEEL